MENSGNPENRTRYLLRVVRPLFWWFLLVLALFGIRTHQRLMEKTRISFNLTMQGRQENYLQSAISRGDTPFGATATFDGKPILSGENISLGNHTFKITHPKTEPFSTNLFIWYGEHNFGTIDLKRAKGTLSIQVAPPAASLSINGAEIAAVTLKTSSGFTSSVPTDSYNIDVRWANYEQTRRVTVGSSVTEFVQFAPQLGAVTFESTPSGAQVIDKDGNDLGTTPLTLRELGTGFWKGEMRLDGYAPTPLWLKISANATSSIHTNLVNWRYAEAMSSAREHFKSGDFDEALAATAAALRVQPNDPDARALQSQISVAGHLQRASTYGKQKEYAKAITELESALKISPDNAEASQLLADFQRRRAELFAENEKRREQDQIEKERQEKLNRPITYFREWTQGRLNSNLFDEQNLVVKGTLAEIEEKLVPSLTNGQPVFSIMTLEQPSANIFRLQAKQNLKTAGWRRCNLVAMENTPGEVTVVFKVYEYAYVESFSIRAWVGDSDDSKMIPIHPSRLDQTRAPLLERRPEGIRIIRMRVLDAATQ